MGTNAKLTEFAAAMGLCNLRHLDEQIAKRRAVVLRYREHLSDVDGLVLCKEQPGVVPNYAYLPIQVIPEQFGIDRNALSDSLSKVNIFVRKYFYPLTSQMPYFERNFSIQPTPEADKISSRILCLPLYADLAMEDVDRVCDAILQSAAKSIYTGWKGLREEA